MSSDNQPGASGSRPPASLPLHLISIVKDGMPFITFHYPELRKLELDWTWHVVEGTAAPVGCTSWCKDLEPGLSADGTTGYIRGLQEFDPRISHTVRSWWPGKVSMFNAVMGRVIPPAVLVQLDSDECWSAEQLTTIHRLLSSREENCAYFDCRYWVGPEMVATGVNCFGNRRSFEWLRAWRIERLSQFETHEPPKLANFEPNPILHEETVAAGLVFDHYAYRIESQLRFKERYYGHPGMVDAWRNLQREPAPVALRDHLPWVKDGAKGERP